MATTQAPAVPKVLSQSVSERPAWAVSGLLMSAVALIFIVVATLLLATDHSTAAASGTASVLYVIGFAIFGGLTPIAPGEARVIQLFGKYKGTTREPGLQWVNPFSVRRKVSTRIRNHESPMAKVNDADGNPIEIAAVVVWQVQDTAMAMYAVDNFVQFVATQTETAVRHIATSYAYESHGSGQLSLRDNADEITQKLSEEIQARVVSAGVHVVESRLTRLSYASEIAQAMLRRQQASAVVGARQTIVEGAVGMVQMALNKLEEEGVVELDEERKATMVSNLLVVLCSEQATAPVVNTGSLYQ
ncbi:MAG TPA: SPFH domain-containing protein [Streptosporangiaceae bacterium]